MNATERDLIMQRWNAVQHELIPELRLDMGMLIAKLEATSKSKKTASERSMLRRRTSRDCVLQEARLLSKN